MVYSTRRFVVCLSVCHFVLVFFSPFSIAITSLGEGRANLSDFRTFVQFVLVKICRFPLPLGVWEGLRFVIVALPGLFSYLFFSQFDPTWKHYLPTHCIPFMFMISTVLGVVVRQHLKSKGGTGMCKIKRVPNNLTCYKSLYSPEPKAFVFEC